jgi:hypothetical protein
MLKSNSHVTGDIYIKGMGWGRVKAETDHHESDSWIHPVLLCMCLEISIIRHFKTRQKGKRKENDFYCCPLERKLSPSLLSCKESAQGESYCGTGDSERGCMALVREEARGPGERGRVSHWWWLGGGGTVAFARGAGHGEEDFVVSLSDSCCYDPLLYPSGSLLLILPIQKWFWGLSSAASACVYMYIRVWYVYVWVSVNLQTLHMYSGVARHTCIPMLVVCACRCMHICLCVRFSKPGTEKAKCRSGVISVSISSSLLADLYPGLTLVIVPLPFLLPYLHTVSPNFIF